MRRGVDIGIHTDRDRGDQSRLGGHGIDHFEFFLGLDVEAIDSLAQGVVDLAGYLADAGKRAAVGAAAGLEHLEEFASGDDVKASPFLREQIQDGEVAIGLHRVADHAVP